ncbi:MAG TPA: ABC transporter permease [Thermoanaerobaculia bacterium]|nr:ABC transporter permease [Thermoanaerobaculia bacterium]
MYVGESVRTSFEEIKAHPLRSLFTLVGVILGTLALVVVLSVLNGVARAVWEGVNDLGLDGVLSMSNRQPTDRIERAKQYLSRGLRTEDTRWFEGNTLISDVAPVGQNRAVVTAGTITRRVDVWGITPEFVTIKNRKTSDGRFIGDTDIRAKSAVCVLGFKLKQQLFGGDTAVGQQVTLGGRRFTVVGVGTHFNTQFVNDDEMRRETIGMYIPFSVYEDMYGKNAISYVLAKAAEPEKSVEAEDEAVRIYKRAHNGIIDVRIENIGKEILKTRAEVTTIIRNWRIVFFSIAAISLLIGGVGIFSVLKISISERLFEIGLRKSMGATDAEVFVQFLVESITLSVVGAAIGVSAGIALVKFIAQFFPAGLPVQPDAVMIASGFAIFIGLAAGVYPSISASRLTPVEALRA